MARAILCTTRCYAKTTMLRLLIFLCAGVYEAPFRRTYQQHIANIQATRAEQTFLCQPSGPDPFSPLSIAFLWLPLKHAEAAHSSAPVSGAVSVQYLLESTPSSFSNQASNSARHSCPVRHPETPPSMLMYWIWSMKMLYRRTTTLLSRCSSKNLHNHASFSSQRNPKSLSPHRPVFDHTIEVEPGAKLARTLFRGQRTLFRTSGYRAICNVVSFGGLDLMAAHLYSS